MFNKKNIVKVLSILLLSEAFFNIKTVSQAHATSFKRRLSSMFSTRRNSISRRPILPNHAGLSSQLETNNLIKHIHKSKGKDKALLYDAVKNYTGIVEETKLENIYRFSDGKRSMNIYLDKKGNPTSLIIINGNKLFSKDY